MLSFSTLRSVVIFAAWVLAACAHAHDDKPSLVIVGGALEDRNEAVWQAFVSGLRETGPVVVVSAASGSPQSSGDAAKEALALYGIAADRVVLAPLAVRDDRSTDRVDESLWAENANDPETAALIEGAAGVWFTGGDQARIGTVFLTDGRPSLALVALKTAHENGAVIGGTSAGAAMMSDTMIVAGDTMTVLTGDDAGDPLELHAGLGLFDYGVIDQHFDARARLGRLAAALLRLPQDHKRIGFGVDEDTALIVSRHGELTVAGAGYVTVLDARSATGPDSGVGAFSGLIVHLMSPGDVMYGDTLALRPASWKEATQGNEYIENARPGGGGMASAGQMLPDVIGEGLIDNLEAREASRISFTDTGAGVRYRFTQLPQSAGFWGRGPMGVGRYTIANIAFDIEPVTVTVRDMP